MLKFATADKPLVLILDSLDQLSKEHNAYKLNWLPRKLPPHVHFLVSTYTEALDLIGTLRLVIKGGTFIDVPTFTQELSSQVVKSWLEMNKRTLTLEQFELVEKVFKKCSLPLFVKLTYDQVSLWRSYRSIDRCQLTNTIQQCIESLFTQLEHKHGTILVTRALSYVTASGSGISETELEDLLSLDDTVLTDVYQRHIPPFRRIPPLLWVRIRHDISQYLVDKEVDEVRSFFWYHRQFYEAAASRYLSDRAFKKEINSLMADYYLGIWYGVKKPFKYTSEQMKRLGISSPDGEADRRISEQPLIFTPDNAMTNVPVRYNKRKLNKLPRHLFQAYRHETLRSTCLYNLKWIVAKIKGVSLTDLIADYKKLGEQDGVLHKTLKAAKSTLKKYPETVAMEICGRLLSLLQARADKHEKVLLEETVEACAKECKLIPYLPCYNIPSESELYTIEHPSIYFDPKISEISSDSTHFAILSEKGTKVFIWDLKAGEMESSLQLPVQEDQTLNIFMKPPRKDVVVVATCHQIKGNPVFIINLNTGTLEHGLQLEKVYQKLLFFDSATFDLTNDLLLYSVHKQAADIFDLKTGKLLHEFDGEPEAAMFVSDEDLILTHPKQTNVYNLYKTDGFECVYQVSCIATPKAMFIDKLGTIGCVVMENNSTLQFLNLKNNDKDLGKTLGKMDVSSGSKIVNVSINQSRCLVTMLDGFIVYEMPSLKRLKSILIPQEYKPFYRVLDYEAVLSPDGTNICAGYDRHLIIWDIKSGSLIHSLEVGKSRVTKLLISPSGEYLVTKNSRNNHIKAWSVESLKKKARSYQPLSLSNSVRYMCMNRAGSTAVLRSMNSNEFAVIDIHQGIKRVEISHDFEAMVPCVTQDGKYAVLREYLAQECLKIWDTHTGEMVCSIPINSLHLKAYILGNKPENMVVLTADDTTMENILTFYQMPSAEKTGLKIPLGQYNMFQLFFVLNDKYILVGVEEQLHPGINFFTKSYNVQTGEEFRTYPLMHPRRIQMITPDSDSFLGQRKHTAADGKESWELVVINIETGEDMMTSSELPVTVMSIGHIGQYGIDQDTNLFDIKKGKKCFRFDPECPNRKTTPKAKLTSDEKYALWVDIEMAILKIGDVQTGSILGKVPTHSMPMNLEVTPTKIVLIGCEDGRFMMLQIIPDMDENMVGNTLKRSTKKGLKVRDSVLKVLIGGDTVRRDKSANNNKGKSKMCELM